MTEPAYSNTLTPPAEPLIHVDTGFHGLDRRDEAAIARAAAEAMGRRLASFRAYYAMTPALMHSIDATGRIREVSDHWLERFGYAREEVIGRPSIEFLTEESQQFARTTILPEFWRTGRCARVPYTYVAKDGALVDVELSAEMVSISGEQLSLAVLEDVSERNAAARRLQEANDALRQFAGLASHDLRGPLGKIARLSDLLCGLDARTDDLERRRLLGRIGDTAREMSALVDAMLEMSASSYRGAPGDGQALALVIENALEELSQAVIEAGAEVAVSIAPAEGAPALRGDARLLKHVFVNLVDNALKHSGRAGVRIRIEAEAHDGAWTIAVSDNGDGVDPAIADRVFDARVRGRGDADGFGIGLVLVKRVVEGHGGAISLDRGCRSGARFVVTLPAQRV